MRSFRGFTGFAIGLFSGMAIYPAALHLGGFSTIKTPELEVRQNLVAELRQENHELTDELLQIRGQLAFMPETGDLPYDGDDDASLEVAAARAAAMQDRKFLMVTFGANWCMDCRNLHRMLHSEDVEDYTRDLFRFINVDVGKFNQNRNVAEDLGVSLSRGIPVAIFFDPQGQVIGTTNEGQLEPARRYTSKQILKFVRDIAERSRVAAPDSVE
jgi:protein disulfide-isomerase